MVKAEAMLEELRQKIEGLFIQKYFLSFEFILKIVTLEKYSSYSYVLVNQGDFKGVFFWALLKTAEIRGFGNQTFEKSQRALFRE